MPLSRVTILNDIPISGTWPEKHFGTIELKNIWVEFELTDGQSWYGLFAASNFEYGLTDVVFEPDNDTAFISAGGTGYYVNTDTKELIFETEEFEPVHSTIRTQKPNFLVYSDQQNVYFLSGNAIERTVNLGFVDGVYITSIENENLVGDLWEINADHYNIRFFIDLVNFEYRTDNKILIDRKSHSKYRLAEPPKGILQALFGKSKGR